MKIAVTGASGFLGRHILRELCAHSEIDIVGMIRCSSTPPIADGRIRYVHGDTAACDPDIFRILGCPDVVIHLAWSGLPNYKSRHHFETELPNQYQFLSRLVNSGLSSLVCAGTCFEYGLRSGELAEELLPDPKNPYAHAKVALHSQLSFLRESADFRLVWARLFYMFGEGQPATTLYSQLASAIRRGEKTFRMSRGEQLRDYLHVGNVARYLVKLAQNATDSTVVNVCSGRPISVRALVERWLDESGKQMELELGYYPYPDYEPMAFWGSNRKLLTILGESTVHHEC